MKIVKGTSSKKAIGPWLSSILVVAFCLSSCSTMEDIVQSLMPTATIEPQEEAVEAQALITFNVRIPEDTPADQPILLSILDEVTGLALNAQRYPMETGENGEFSLALPFPVGTVVKYRYSRRGEILAEEHTTDGRAVRYRLFYVTAPAEVHDVVSQWNDTSFEGKAGRITGLVRDGVTNQAIPGMLITAGGFQAFTTGDGRFLIEGLPPGTHNLVALSPDGRYTPFQQGALVSQDSNTPATITLNKADTVDITFLVHVPEGTPPAVPIRLAGNILQLGNTFADLSGGVSTLASRMPVLSPVGERTYGIILNLPAGTHLTYKFTLGDGFWNTERTLDGRWKIRELIVPQGPTTVEDSVSTWQVGNNAPITFDVIVPENTPEDEGVFIQFNPYGWTEPLPMWHLGGQRWAYILYSPLDMLERLGYRYCRAGQCGHADDIRTPGVFTSGQIVQPAEDPQDLPDEIEAWIWWGQDRNAAIDLSQVVVEEYHEAGLVTGVEFQSRFHPSWTTRIQNTMADVADLETNWVIMTPGWTFTRSDPPVLEPVSGQNPMWQDSVQMIQAGRREDLMPVLRPIGQFPTQADIWWREAARDFPWWVSWFNGFAEFTLHHAALAEANQVKDLILGGEWISPALPGGTLSSGEPSGVPPDANSRYGQLIEEVREIYNGRIGWALSYPEVVLNPPEFLDEVDFIYILWDEALSEVANPTIADMQAEAERMLTTELYLLWLSLQGTGDSEPPGFILSLAYPSIEAGTNPCLADPHQDCIFPSSLDYPAPDFPLLETDLDLQAQAYYAMLAAISQHPWINGVVSRGFYPPALLQDKSISIHGKPAEQVFRVWNIQLLESIE